MVPSSKTPLLVVKKDGCAVWYLGSWYSKCDIAAPREIYSVKASTYIIEGSGSPTPNETQFLAFNLLSLYELEWNYFFD